MSGRYARPVAFLTDRLRPGRALGLLLTVQLGVLVALGAGFGTVVDDVTENDELTSIDLPVSGFLIGAREPGLNRFFEVLTWAGSAALLVPLVGLVGLWLRWVTSSRGPLIFLLTSLIGAMTLSTLIKLVVARPRPPLLALVDAVGYAFPSGHATIAMAGWLSLALVLGGLTSRWAVKVALLTAAAALAGLVGLSRVYLGVHEPTDVLGGWLLAALWVVAVLVAMRLLRSRRKAAPTP
ncbi:MAG TPA: phosphatase PAP2 family protein [Pseudonocardiaceae bacterium]|nr:phosphatase PAP2 family protein [Pseudonocardiaceae bacterium]